MSAKVNKELEKLVRDYADAREGLANVVDEVTDAQRKLVRQRMRTIQSRAAVASAAKDALVQYIDENRDLFAKPRTQSIHGIKFGMRKQPGKVVGDSATIIGLIRKKLPDMEDALIRTKDELVAAALKELDVRDLAKIGASLVDGDDKVIIEAADDDVDKLVESMMKEVSDEEGGPSK